MDFARLIQLQEIDKKLSQLRSSLGELPDEVDYLKTKVENFNREHENLKNETDTCAKTKLKIEGQIALLNEKLKKYQEQFYSVTTNKEYDAISAEIESTKVEISNHETQFLELLEKEEKLTQKIEVLQSQVNLAKKELAEKDAELQSKLAQNEEKSQALQNERKNTLTHINRPLLSTYERIRKARRGKALAEVKNYTCEECFATIPAQTVVEIRKGNRVILCESCGRILVTTNNVKEPQNSVAA